MENLQCGSALEHLFRKTLLVQGIRGKAERRTQPFSPNLYHIPERVIKATRFVSETDVLEKACNRFFNLVIASHSSGFSKQIYKI